MKTGSFWVAFRIFGDFLLMEFRVSLARYRMLDRVCADGCAIWRLCCFHIPDVGIRELLPLLLAEGRRFVLGIFMPKSLGFGDILDFGLGYLG